MWLCHRLPERSFFWREKQFPVCARCTGLWLGLAGTSLLSPWYVLPWWLGVILSLPIVLDGGTQLIGWRYSNNWLRFCTGVAGGIGAITLLVAVLSAGAYTSILLQA